MESTNLLVIMSDQHSPHVVGCYGNRAVRTPNIDALAAAGTRFAYAYTPSPVCVPARASFATGRYPHEIDAWDNAKPYTGAEAPSWGHRLTGQGHAVVTVGKLHYRRVDDPTGFPDQRLPMHVLDGVGDVYSLLRGDMPVRPQSRHHVLDAGPGESSYIRYDRAVAQESARFLTEEAGNLDAPWALFVSFVTPHFPLKVPEQYFNLYPPDSLPWPVAADRKDWPDHPAIAAHRAVQALDEPFAEAAVRNAMAAYYGMVTFLDDQIGIVLQALSEAGLAGNTRIIYTSDHGEMLGEHGCWWKGVMYEGAAGIPLIVSGPGVPAGKVVQTNASLVDLFPTIVGGVGTELAPEDDDLPGRSLFELAAEPDRARTVFSEYHTIFMPSAVYMIQTGRYTYVHYVDHPPQLFDRANDPRELTDLAADPTYAEVLTECESRLRTILDPVETDRRANADQRDRLEAAGGAEAVLAAGVKIPFTPAPGIPDHPPAPARDRLTLLQD